MTKNKEPRDYTKLETYIVNDINDVKKGAINIINGHNNYIKTEEQEMEWINYAYGEDIKKYNLVITLSMRELNPNKSAYKAFIHRYEGYGGKPCISETSDPYDYSYCDENGKTLSFLTCSDLIAYHRGEEESKIRAEEERKKPKPSFFDRLMMAFTGASRMGPADQFFYTDGLIAITAFYLLFVIGLPFLLVFIYFGPIGIIALLLLFSILYFVS